MRHVDQQMNVAATWYVLPNDANVLQKMIFGTMNPA